MRARSSLSPLAATLALAAAAAVLPRGAAAAPSGNWSLVWSDEFDGPVVNASNWNVYNNTVEGDPRTSNQIEV
jgi:hypothetical protein